MLGAYRFNWVDCKCVFTRIARIFNEEGGTIPFIIQAEMFIHIHIYTHNLH